LEKRKPLKNREKIVLVFPAVRRAVPRYAASFSGSVSCSRDYPSDAWGDSIYPCLYDVHGQLLDHSCARTPACPHEREPLEKMCDVCPGKYQNPSGKFWSDEAGRMEACSGALGFCAQNDGQLCGGCCEASKYFWSTECCLSAGAEGDLSKEGSTGCVPEKAGKERDECKQYEGYGVTWGPGVESGTVRWALIAVALLAAS